MVHCIITRIVISRPRLVLGSTLSGQVRNHACLVASKSCILGTFSMMCIIIRSRRYSIELLSHHSQLHPKPTLVAGPEARRNDVAGSLRYPQLRRVVSITSRIFSIRPILQCRLIQHYSRRRGLLHLRKDPTEEHGYQSRQGLQGRHPRRRSQD